MIGRQRIVLRRQSVVVTSGRIVVLAELSAKNTPAGGVFLVFSTGPFRRSNGDHGEVRVTTAGGRGRFPARRKHAVGRKATRISHEFRFSSRELPNHVIKYRKISNHVTIVTQIGTGRV
jgi:hypothetical protein